MAIEVTIGAAVPAVNVDIGQSATSGVAPLYSRGPVGPAGPQGPQGVPGPVDSTNLTVLNIIRVTQSEYDLLDPPVETTLYIIVDEE